MKFILALCMIFSMTSAALGGSGVTKTASSSGVPGGTSQWLDVPKSLYGTFQEYQNLVQNY